MISSGNLIEENFEKFKNYKGEKIPTKIGIILRKVIPTNLKEKRDTTFVRNWATRLLKAHIEERICKIKYILIRMDVIIVVIFEVNLVSKTTSDSWIRAPQVFWGSQFIYII